MLLQFENLTIRNAAVRDAEQLAAWWNDGAVMAHAGFPMGLSESVEEVAEKIGKDTEENRRLIIEKDGRPVGEMNYRKVAEGVAEIGIKICDFSLHGQGLGKKLLSMMISSLFRDFGYQKIVLDTNLENKRAQHVYEELGFRKVCVHENSWRNQLGEPQSSVDYEMYPGDFVDFAK